MQAKETSSLISCFSHPFSSSIGQILHQGLCSSPCHSDDPTFLRTEQVNQHTLYPFIHSFSNVKSSSSITSPVCIPDVQPSDLPQPSDFSLVAGDFIEIYGVTDEDVRSGEVTDGKSSQEGQWNAVLTCFFIDTVSFKSSRAEGSNLNMVLHQPP